MRKTKHLIKDNNEKRNLLSEENRIIYEDFLLYFRTDLRVAEQEGEELLIDLLDHLLEGQEIGKTATDLFGSQPRTYADELIAGLPNEKKRNVISYVSSQIFNLVGLFSLLNGIAIFILPGIKKYDDTTLGNLVVLITIILMVTALGVTVIFKIIRSTIFSDENQKRKAFWIAGLWGLSSFILVLFITWLLPDFGPEVYVEWYVYLGLGALLIVISKLVRSIT